MINPVYFSIPQTDGSKRVIIIEPVLEKIGGEIRDTENYKLYKSSIDNESDLFTENLEINEKNDDLADENNPDYLGLMIVPSIGEWHYEGDLLDDDEQVLVFKRIVKKAE